MTFSKFVLAAGLGIGLGFSSALSAATVTTTAAANTVASSIDGTVSGLAVQFSAFTLDDDLGNMRAARVGYDGRGFGVAGLSGTGGKDANGKRIRASDFFIDGLGVDRNELLQLRFGTTVTISALQFAGVDDFDDFYIAVSGQPGMRLSNQGTSLGTFLPLTGRSFDIMAGFPYQSCKTSPTQACGGHTDSFQLTGVTVAAVPLPAALPLLAAAIGVLGFVAHRRRA